MEQVNQIPTEIKMVCTEHIPEKFFVYSAKIMPDVGKSLNSLYKEGTSLSRDIQALYNEHLLYTYDLSEKEAYWEAGPAIDFTQILYIFATENLEQAQKFMQDDPLYKAKVFYDDRWFHWVIHNPYWKVGVRAEMLEWTAKKFGATPEYPPGIKPPVREIKVTLVTPRKLIVSIVKIDGEMLGKINADIQAGNPVPAFFVYHTANRAGIGGTGPMGYDWESGPSIDWQHDISIFSVNSLEMAQMLRENDAFVRYGAFYDPVYFEWCIHLPLRKASPAHRETLKKSLRGAGVTIIE